MDGLQIKKSSTSPSIAAQRLERARQQALEQRRVQGVVPNHTAAQVDTFESNVGGTSSPMAAAAVHSGQQQLPQRSSVAPPGFSVPLAEAQLAERASHLSGKGLPLLTSLVGQQRVEGVLRPRWAFFGPPATGKTTLVRHLSEISNRPIYHIIVHRDTKEEDLFGRGPHWQAGRQVGSITAAILESGLDDGILFLDEIDKVIADRSETGTNVLTALSRLLDPEKTSFYDAGLGCQVSTKKFCFVTAGNDLARFAPYPFFQSRLGEVLDFAPFTTSQLIDLVERHLWQELVDAVPLASSASCKGATRLSLTLGSGVAAFLVRSVQQPSLQEQGARALAGLVERVVLAYIAQAQDPGEAAIVDVSWLEANWQYISMRPLSDDWLRPSESQERTLPSLTFGDQLVQGNQRASDSPNNASILAAGEA